VIELESFSSALRAENETADAVRNRYAERHVVAEDNEVSLEANNCTSTPAQAPVVSEAATSPEANPTATSWRVMSVRGGTIHAVPEEASTMCARRSDATAINTAGPPPEALCAIDAHEQLSVTFATT
jgi:hypothetical protein